jgi:hypothetical protein
VSPANDDARDVVGSAVFVGFFDELCGSGSDVAVFTEDVGNLRVGHWTRQTVGTKHVGVVDGRDFETRIDLDGLFHAERSNDDVLVREVRNFLGREAFHLDVVVEQRVVFGEALELRVAVAIDAAVTNVRDVHAIVRREDRNERRAHAALFRFALRRFVDAQVGEFDAGNEAILFVPFRAVHLVGPRSLGVVLRLRKELLHRIDCHLRCDFARSMATHSIGNDEQAILRHDREVVLVMVALAADVRLAGYLNTKLLSHSSPNVEDGGRSVS